MASGNHESEVKVIYVMKVKIEPHPMHALLNLNTVQGIQLFMYDHSN
jgi:hypothetical protein